MKHDYLLRDMFYSEFTVFNSRGDLVAINGQEELSFFTVETKHVSRVALDLKPVVTDDEAVRVSLEQQAYKISKLELK